MRSRFLTCLATTAAIGCAGGTSGQEPPVDALRRATSLIRSQQGVNEVAAMLRAGPNQLDEARRSALADSLEALAVGSSAEPEAVGHGIALTAVRALSHAGARGSEAVFPAHARLVRILEQVHEPRLRLALVTGLAFSGTESQAASTLARIAIEDPDLAFPAVTLLRDVLGEDGLVSLRRLFLQDRVTNERARAVVRQMAIKYGWDN